MLNTRKSPETIAAAPVRLTDDQLIAAYVNEQNTDYFGILFERYTHLVYGVCMKYLKNSFDAEDAVMEIFEKLMTDLKKHEVRNFKNWLYRVSKNHCLMILRKRKAEAKAESEIGHDEHAEFMELLFSGHHHYEDENDGGILISLRDAMNKLKEEQRVCIEMMYLEKKSYQEIADLTSYNLKQVKSYIQNGKRNLKIMLVPK